LRIQSQRDTFASTIHIASEFDWRPVPSGEACRTCGWTGHHDVGGKNEERAHLENGHELHAWGWRDLPPDSGHSYSIVDPSKYPEEPSKYAPHQGPEVIAARGRDTDDPEQTYIPTMEDAKRMAEEHYKQLFPIGTDTGPHDSGVDYSGLNSFKDYL
jgi:hypothetical protein